jgi:iron complex outermembrane receptor protein
MDPAQLRSLGTDQVLVLINGKRRHQASLVNVNGTINRGQVNTDLSAIPASAIERVEILRDGASAQYGSDAIAGVINIVLKKNPGILEAGVSYGEYKSKYPKNYALYKLQGKTDDPEVSVTDGKTIQANLGYGFKIKKGFLNLNSEYIHRDPTNRTGTYTGQIFPSVNGANKDDSIIAARGLTRNTSFTTSVTRLIKTVSSMLLADGAKRMAMRQACIVIQAALYWHRMPVSMLRMYLLYIPMDFCR